MTPEDRKKIIEAAQAIVDRWDSPAWKYGDPHTGVLIRDLVRTIARLRAEPEKREPKVMSNEEIERIAEALCASMDAYTDWEDRHGYKQTGIRFLTYACDNNLFAPLDRSRMEAIETLKTVIDLWHDELIGEGYDTSTNFDKATQAISTLSGG